MTDICFFFFGKALVKGLENSTDSANADDPIAAQVRSSNFDDAILFLPQDIG